MGIVDTDLYSFYLQPFICKALAFFHGSFLLPQCLMFCGFHLYISKNQTKHFLKFRALVVSLHVNLLWAKPEVD